MRRLASIIALAALTFAGPLTALAAPTANFTLTISATAPPATPPTSPPTVVNGGGGSGSGSSNLNVPPTTGATARFYGQASPFARVSLLRDGQDVADAVADQSAGFSVSVSGLSPTDYAFDLVTFDQTGVQAALYPLHVSVQSNTTYLISNIVIAPTVTLAADIVAPGQSVSAHGLTVPNARVTGYVDDASTTPVFSVDADAQGRWQGEAPMGATASGTHFLKAFAKTEASQSPPSRALVFGIGTAPVADISAVDFNEDARVNIVDFSILAYWYKRPNPPSRFDLNHDGTIDIRDFSILAFYWTG